MAEYVLFGGGITRAAGPQMVLDELGLAYELREVDPAKGEHKSVEFRAINPAGFVPALITPDGAQLHEAAGIMLYLADRHGRLAPGPGDPKRGLFLSKLFYLSHDIQPTVKQFFYPERFSPDPEFTRARAWSDAQDRWSVIEDHLHRNGPYHLGDEISVVDILMAMWAAYGYAKPMDILDNFPAVRRCYALVHDRPSCGAHLDRLHAGIAAF